MAGDVPVGVHLLDGGLQLRLLLLKRHGLVEEKNLYENHDILTQINQYWDSNHNESHLVVESLDGILGLGEPGLHLELGGLQLLGLGQAVLLVLLAPEGDLAEGL